LKAGVRVDVLLSGVERYATYCAVSKTEPGFIKQPATFFGPGEHYLADWTPTESQPRHAMGANKFSAAAAGIFSTPKQAEVIDV
jgi:hypothetical protein